MYRRKNRQNEIEIHLEDVELIMGKNYSRLPAILKTVFCTQCSGQTTIEKFRIYLDDTNDIIFDGFCSRCNDPVSRYVETGESLPSCEIAAHIRNVKRIN